MRIGVPKEIKPLEHRVGLVPSSVKELTSHGHDVLVETNCGKAINFTDEDYERVGAKIIDTPQEVYAKADMIVKVKEPQKSEYGLLRENQILFTYLHLAADAKQTEALINSKCVAIAYETVTGSQGYGLPLLEPMSEIAGRLSIQVGAHYLQKHLGGQGLLLGGVPGVKPGKVLILGGGVAGFNAAKMAVGLGANVTVLEKSNPRMRFLDQHFEGRVNILYSTLDTLEQEISEADLIIGAVLIPGATAPKLVSKKMLASIKNGSVMVDIAIDQGGCFETSKATTHDDPIYVIDDVIHYCVTNMPGTVPLSSALALNHSVIPYTLRLADKGWESALGNDENFRNGLNVCRGKITNKAVADSLGLNYEPLETSMAA